MSAYLYNSLMSLSGVVSKHADVIDAKQARDRAFAKSFANVVLHKKSIYAPFDNFFNAHHEYSGGIHVKSDAVRFGIAGFDHFESLTRKAREEIY